jgi:nicotinamide-nucleotide amidase
MTYEFSTLTARLAELLVRRDERLVVAESCTGGWVAKVCTDRAGSSAWFDRGFVTYSNEAKQELLGVSQSTLAGHGAVSRGTVIEMAAGALARSRAHWAVAISGIAGPSGGSAAKPVGTVWFAWAGTDGWQRACEERFAGDRDTVRACAVKWSLQVLVDYLDQVR